MHSGWSSRWGPRRAGDIERLAQVARPDLGIVTKVANAHLEYFGDLDGVARAKGELVAALPARGVAVLNFDDSRVREMARLSACRVLGYAVGADAEVRADDFRLDLVKMVAMHQTAVRAPPVTGSGRKRPRR